MAEDGHQLRIADCGLQIDTETENTHVPGVSDTVVKDNRIEFHRGNLVERYVNDKNGVEQAFTE